VLSLIIGRLFKTQVSTKFLVFVDLFRDCIWSIISNICYVYKIIWVMGHLTKVKRLQMIQKLSSELDHLIK